MFIEKNKKGLSSPRPPDRHYTAAAAAAAAALPPPHTPAISATIHRSALTNAVLLPTGCAQQLLLL